MLNGNPTPLESSPVFGCGDPICCERYIVPARYRWLFHMQYPPIPATSWARGPLMTADAAGVGAELLLTQGKPQAGVLFQRSSTVGLLFSVIPYVKSLWKSFVELAYRTSVLSQRKWAFWLSYVTCTKLP